MCCEKLNVLPGALQRMRWELPSHGRGRDSSRDFRVTSPTQVGSPQVISGYPRAGPSKGDGGQVVVTRTRPAGVSTCPLQLHQS